MIKPESRWSLFWTERLFSRVFRKSLLKVTDCMSSLYSFCKVFSEIQIISFDYDFSQMKSSPQILKIFIPLWDTFQNWTSQCVCILVTSKLHLVSKSKFLVTSRHQRSFDFSYVYQFFTSTCAQWAHLF